jgi:hypothetical protein
VSFSKTLESISCGCQHGIFNCLAVYRALGDDKTKTICIDIIRNNKYSEFVLADAYDVMKYQFGRLPQTQKIFDEFEQSIKSCPKIFSIGNKVRPPKFLQK